MANIKMTKKEEKKAPETGAKAPKVQKEEKVDVNNATVVDFTKSLTPEQMQLHVAGLDPNRRADLIRVMHETFRMDPKAADHTGFPQETINIINKLNAAMQIGAVICEVAVAQNPFTMLMPPQMVENMKLLSGEMGFKVNLNLLPEPNKDGNIPVPSSAISIDSETKKSAKEEDKIVNEKPILNPNEMKDEEQLKKAIIYVLADTKTNVRPYDRINAAIDMYYSWLYFRATDEAAKEKLKERSRAVLFKEMTDIVGYCPFSISGISKILYNSVAETKTPISAFCLLRNNSLEKSTGHPTVDDSLIAAFVRILVTWHATSCIKDDQEAIETCKQNIEVLSKNKKQNKAAIEKEQQKIKDYEATIECRNEVIGFVTNPSSYCADILPEAYDDKDHDDYKVSRRIVHNLFNTYYNGIDMKTVEHECLKHNMQQYIGVVLNFFCDSAETFKNYSESNISELVFIKPEEKKPESEEEKTEEPSKKQQRPYSVKFAIMRVA